MRIDRQMWPQALAQQGVLALAAKEVLRLQKGQDAGKRTSSRLYRPGAFSSWSQVLGPLVRLSQEPSCAVSKRRSCMGVCNALQLTRPLEVQCASPDCTSPLALSKFEWNLWAKTNPGWDRRGTC